MHIDKSVRPYMARVSSDGTRTTFSCQDSSLDKQTNTWTNSMWYSVSVDTLNFPIEKKNPEGYKIVPKKITGITFGEWQGKPQITVWCDDVEIQDKDGKTIIASSKKGAKVVGKKVKDLGSEPSPVEGFQAIEDEEIPF